MTIRYGIYFTFEVPYTIIISNKAKHVPSNIEKYILSEWCYKKKLILYSDKDKEKELNRLINDIVMISEEMNDKYEKDLYNTNERIKKINKILRKNTKIKY